MNNDKKRLCSDCEDVTYNYYKCDACWRLKDDHEDSAPALEAPVDSLYYKQMRAQNGRKASLGSGRGWEKTSKNTYRSRIYFNGNVKYLGYFRTKEEAVMAYRNAVNELLTTKAVDRSIK